MAKSSKPIVDYDDPSFDYERYWQKRRYEHLAEELVLKKFFKLIPQKDSLIDIGGGFGRLTPLYAPIFKNSLLVDPSARLIDEAMKLRTKYSGFEAKRGTAEKLPVKDENFTVALMVRMIHHLPSFDQAFGEVNRVLRPGGYFILEFANKLHFKAILKTISTLNFFYLTDHTPVERSDEVVFYNLHPTLIVSLLKKNGFKIVRAVSVSNFRATFLKKILPLKVLFFLERIAQKVYPAYISGPSVFVLAQKL